MTVFPRRIILAGGILCPPFLLSCCTAFLLIILGLRRPQLIVPPIRLAHQLLMIAYFPFQTVSCFFCFINPLFFFTMWSTLTSPLPLSTSCSGADSFWGSTAFYTHILPLLQFSRHLLLTQKEPPAAEWFLFLMIFYSIYFLILSVLYPAPSQDIIPSLIIS